VEIYQGFGGGSMTQRQNFEIYLNKTGVARSSPCHFQQLTARVAAFYRHGGG